MGKIRKVQIAVLCILQMIAGLYSVLVIMLLRQIIDAAVSGNFVSFRRYIFLLIGIIIFQLANRFCIRMIEEKLRCEIENDLKSQLFKTLLNRDYATVSIKHSEEWMNRLTSDTVVVADGTVQILPGFLCMLIKILAAIIAISVLEIHFVYFLIPCGIVFMSVSLGFRKILKYFHKKIQEADGRLRIFLQEHLANLIIIKSFVREQETTDAAFEKMQQHQKARMQRNFLSSVCNTFFAMALNVIYMTGVIYCGYGILRGTMTYGTFLAITQLVGQLQNPMANITGYIPRYYAMQASTERLREAENLQDDIGERKNSEELLRFYNEEFLAVQLKNVSFTYPESNRCIKDIDVISPKGNIVLKDFNLTIRKGEYIAITGNSGCGKSTLLKIMMALYSLTDGACQLIKTTGEEELNAAWRGLFAYVPQGNQLMSGTIREILSFGNRENMWNETRIQKALKISCMDEVICGLEKGIDTVLGENGLGLSEGQMQRLAIARAIFSEHPILILDEATSALDMETEKKVLHRLKEMTDRTVVIVTHRKAVLEICDRRIHMEVKKYQ